MPYIRTYHTSLHLYIVTFQLAGIYVEVLHIMMPALGEEILTLIYSTTRERYIHSNFGSSPIIRIHLISYNTLCMQLPYAGRYFFVSTTSE